MFTSPIHAQLPDSLAVLATVGDQYRVVPNITYLTANNWDAKLDVYVPRPRSRDEVPPPNPTLIYIHGGGWTGGAKESSQFRILPYIATGWSVINVEYRLAKVSLAPAAVEDCRCALRWVYAHAKEYSFDTSKIVVSGDSAGGHLALMTGMLAPTAGLDRQCPGTDDLKV
ncbi:MAG: alpha/beta hydrolase, partial [Acidobacteria bacterium]|nr:alpha/beta hydrolase [Acidobacteriota bacterium]